MGEEEIRGGQKKRRGKSSKEGKKKGIKEKE